MTTTLTPYLSFNGTTREAYAFYEQALGAKIQTMMRYGDMPKMEGQNEGCAGAPLVADAIMHACLELPGGAMLFAGDVPPHMMPAEGYRGIRASCWRCSTTRSIKRRARSTRSRKAAR